MFVTHLTGARSQGGGFVLNKIRYLGGFPLMEVHQAAGLFTGISFRRVLQPLGHQVAARASALTAVMSQMLSAPSFVFSL